MEIKYGVIILEGIDKTGKDTLVQYIDKLCNHRYAIYQRGNISNISYAKIFDREEKNKYTFNDNIVYVLLTADLEDLKIRFKMTNEPYTNIEKDSKVFKETFYEILKDKKTLEFNTSEKTPYQIAKEIVKYINELNNL